MYHCGIGRVCGVPFLPTLVATLAGGLLGAQLLPWTSSAAFDRVLPWLFLLATLALAFGRRLGPALRARFRTGLPAVLAIQFLLGIYGGYFGGAVGLVMMAAWSLLDSADMKALNPPRTLLVSAANTIAVLCFVIASAVRWPQALLVGAGAICGGYGGAQLGRYLPSALIRAATLVLAIVMTLMFFLRVYL